MPQDSSDRALAAIAMERCGMPGFLADWVDRFYEPGDLVLLKCCGDGALPETELTEALVAAGQAPDASAARGMIRRAVVRGVLSDTSANSIQTADFHVRFDYWALFEGWLDLPDAVRWQLNHWELEDYIRAHGRTALALKAGKARDPRQVVPEYVLLHEAQALIKRVPRIYLWPCNCRSMFEQCRQPRLTCLRFDNARGIGWEISKTRAQAILFEASRKSLMHSAELGLDEGGAPKGAICNCCSDCCFPHRLAQQERVAGHWPITRYVARLDALTCNGCGRCERRCPFGAIEMRKHTDPDRPPAAVLTAERCRGCGVCAVGCRQDAIEMIQLRESIFEAWYQPPRELPV